MQDQPSTFRSGLPALFICIAVVGLWLLCRVAPHPWLVLIINLVLAFSVAYALISVLVSTGNRRLSSAAFAATAVVLLSIQLPITECFSQHYRLLLWFKMLVHDNYSPHNYLIRGLHDRLFVIMLSVAAAYLLPWIVQRGQPSTNDSQSGETPMQDQPNPLRFTVFLTGLLVLCILAGWSCLAWVVLVLELAVAFTVAYALTVVLVSTGSRRLFWAAFAGPAVVLLITGGMPFQGFRMPILEMWLQPFFGESETWGFWYLTYHVFVLIVSTAAAYIIPWLVQREKS